MCIPSSQPWQPWLQGLSPVITIIANPPTPPWSSHWQWPSSQRLDSNIVLAETFDKETHQSNQTNKHRGVPPRKYGPYTNGIPDVIKSIDQLLQDITLFDSSEKTVRETAKRNCSIKPSLVHLVGRLLFLLMHHHVHVSVHFISFHSISFHSFHCIHA